jgi:hypothetical protein
MAKSTPVNSTPVKPISLGAPYYQLGGVLQAFLKEKGRKTGLTLAQIIRDVHEEWGKRKQRPPVPQTFYQAVYGVRPLPLEVVLFMIDRYGFQITFDDCFNAMNREGARVKANDVRMPRMRELF